MSSRSWASFSASRSTLGLMLSSGLVGPGELPSHLSDPDDWGSWGCGSEGMAAASVCPPRRWMKKGKDGESVRGGGGGGALSDGLLGQR